VVGRCSKSGRTVYEGTRLIKSLITANFLPNDELQEFFQNQHDFF